MNDKQKSLTLLNEPSPYAKELVEALLPFCEVKYYPKNSRLALLKGDVKLCHLVISGSFEVHRSPDYLVIVTIQAPTVIGLSVHDAYILTVGPSKIATLTLEDAQRHIAEQGLWELATRHLMQLTNKLYSYSKQLSAPTVYEVICNQLIALMGEPESLRKSISAERYIRCKTHVSRSSVMKILADLKTGKYIIIEGGRLIEIHHLPLKY